MKSSNYETLEELRARMAAEQEERRIRLAKIRSLAKTSSESPELLSVGQKHDSYGYEQSPPPIYQKQTPNQHPLLSETNEERPRARRRPRNMEPDPTLSPYLTPRAEQARSHSRTNQLHSQRSLPEVRIIEERHDSPDALRVLNDDQELNKKTSILMLELEIGDDRPTFLDRHGNGQVEISLYINDIIDSLRDNIDNFINEPLENISLVDYTDLIYCIEMFKLYHTHRDVLDREKMTIQCMEFRSEEEIRYLHSVHKKHSEASSSFFSGLLGYGKSNSSTQEEVDLSDIAINEITIPYLTSQIKRYRKNITAEEEKLLLKKQTDLYSLHYRNIVFISRICEAITNNKVDQINILIGKNHTNWITTTLINIFPDLKIIIHPTMQHVDTKKSNLKSTMKVIEKGFLDLKIDNLSHDEKIMALNKLKQKARYIGKQKMELYDQQRKEANESYVFSSGQPPAAVAKNNISFITTLNKINFDFQDYVEKLAGKEKAEQLRPFIAAYTQTIRSMTPGDLVSIPSNRCTSPSHELELDPEEARRSCENLDLKKKEFKTIQNQLPAPAYHEFRHTLRKNMKTNFSSHGQKEDHQKEQKRTSPYKQYN